MLDEVKDYQVPVYIGLEPKSSNLVEAGVGYSTDEGPRDPGELGKAMAESVWA